MEFPTSVISFLSLKFSSHIISSLVSILPCPGNVNLIKPVLLDVNFKILFNESFLAPYSILVITDLWDPQLNYFLHHTSSADRSSLFWKSVNFFIFKIHIRSTELPYASVIRLQSLYPRGMETFVHAQTRIQTCKAAKRGKRPKRLSQMNEQIKCGIATQQRLIHVKKKNRMRYSYVLQCGGH